MSKHFSYILPTFFLVWLALPFQTISAQDNYRFKQSFPQYSQPWVWGSPTSFEVKDDLVYIVSDTDSTSGTLLIYTLNGQFVTAIVDAFADDQVTDLRSKIFVYLTDSINLVSETGKVKRYSFGDYQLISQEDILINGNTFFSTSQGESIADVGHIDTDVYFITYGGDIYTYNLDSPSKSQLLISQGCNPFGGAYSSFYVSDSGIYYRERCDEENLWTLNYFNIEKQESSIFGDASDRFAVTKDNIYEAFGDGYSGESKTIYTRNVGDSDQKKLFSAGSIGCRFRNNTENLFVACGNSFHVWSFEKEQVISSFGTVIDDKQFLPRKIVKDWQSDQVYLLNSAKLESLDEATLSFDQTIIDNFNPYGFSTFDVDDGVLYYIDQVREENNEESYPDTYWLIKKPLTDSTHEEMIKIPIELSYGEAQFTTCFIKPLIDLELDSKFISCTEWLGKINDNGEIEWLLNIWQDRFEGSSANLASVRTFLDKENKLFYYYIDNNNGSHSIYTIDYSGTIKNEFLFKTTTTFTLQDFLVTGGNIIFFEFNKVYKTSLESLHLKKNDTTPPLEDIPSINEDFIMESGIGINQYLSDWDSNEDTFIEYKGDLFFTNYNTSKIIVHEPVIELTNAKAIIIAGGGPYEGNVLWQSTLSTANFAYRALINQGYNKNSIYYISDYNFDLDANGQLDDVDASATKENVENALIEWAADADNLILYMVDHGGVNTFRLGSNQIVNSQQLSSWLDDFQIARGAKPIVIYDACESGTFLQGLTSSSGLNRTVITSTSPRENAVFISQGAISFSNFFWTEIFNGNSIGEAFNQAENALEDIVKHQHPLLDVDGDGNPNEPIDLLDADTLYIGTGSISTNQPPEILGVTATSNSATANFGEISAEISTTSSSIARVWAVIRPPDYVQGDSGNPILDLPSFDLIPDPTDQTVYSNSWDGFSIDGLYTIIVYASDSLGNTSLPAVTTLSVENTNAVKAILVSGLDSAGSESSGDSNVSANIAYDALLQQGYNDDTIYYMSDAGTIGVDVLPSSSNLEFALDSWATDDTHDLVLYLVGAGSSGEFGIASGETVTASELGSWLDSAASVMPGKLTVVMDTDAGGSFISTLSDSTDRIVVSSTEADQDAHFFSSGDISYSKFYWRQVFNGATVRESHLFATRAMRFADGLQEGQLDDDGDGVANTKEDGQLARVHRHGSGILLAGDKPLISSLIISGTSSNPMIEVDDITTTAQIESVYAVVTAPSGSAQTVTLIEDEQGYFIDNLTFYESGSHEVAVYAKDTNGNVSLPVTDTMQATANTSVGAEEETLSIIMTSDGSSTTARFTAGAYLESSSLRSESFSDGDSVIILGSVLPQAEDVGKAADIFVVILAETNSGNKLTYTDLDGNQISWNGKLMDLQPAVEIPSLASSESVSIYTGTLESGSFKAFIGYKLFDGGPIHFNGKAYRLNVSE